LTGKSKEKMPIERPGISLGANIKMNEGHVVD
jgi:hypothetical protein